MSSTPTQTEHLRMRDAEGNEFERDTTIMPDGSHRFRNDVFIQDQHTEIIDLHLTRLIQPVAIDVNTLIDDTSIQITAAAPPTVGSTLCLKEGYKFYQGGILSFTGTNPYTVVVDTPLDYPFTTAGGCSERSNNMAVNGSVTPQNFVLSPANLTDGLEWDITRIALQMVGTAAPDDGKFGTIAALTNGIVVRYTDGITKNLFNAKTNADLALHTGGDVQYIPRTVPAGSHGVRARRTFSGPEKNGVTIRLAATTSDELIIIIQDDLTDITTFEAVAQGHIVD